MPITLAAAATVQGSATSATTVTYTITGMQLVGTTETYLKLAQGQLPSAVGVLYTVPASTTAFVKEIHLSNIGSTAQTVSMFVDGSAAANELTSFVLPASGFAVYDGTWSIYDGNGMLQSGSTYSVPWYDVTRYGADPTFTNDSTGAIQAATAAVGGAGARGIVYFPPGAYMLSAPITSAAYVHFMGAGILSTFVGYANSPTGNMFTVGSSGTMITGMWIWAPQTTTAAGGTLSGTPQTITVGSTSWFPASGTVTIGLTATTWTTMAYTSKTATTFVGCTGSGVFTTGAPIMLKTAGAAIDCSNYSMIAIRDCRIENQYNGIIASGVEQTIADCEVYNTINFGILVNVANAGPVLHNIVMDNTYTSKPVSGIEIQACGVVLMSHCQWIRAQNGCRINPAVAGCYSVNAIKTYFDNCITTGATIIGSTAVQRAKFGECSFSSTSAGSGFVANNVNASEIDINQSNAYLSTPGSGFLFTACADFKLSGCRAAQNAGDGIAITASTPAPSFRIMDCIIGSEVGGLTGNTGAGIRVNAGTYATYTIVNNDLSGNTGAALVDGGTVADPNQKQISGNTGLSVAPTPSVSAATISGTAETVMTAYGGRIYLPANSLLVGTTFKLESYVIITATTPTILPRIRLGTAGTTADTQVVATGATSETTGSPCRIIGYVTIRSIGSGGTAVGNIEIDAGTMSRTTQTATVAVNTTVANYLSFTLTASGTTPVMTPVICYWQVIQQ